MPRLNNNPNNDRARKIRPDHPCLPAKRSANTALATPPPIAAKKVPSSRMPLPHDSRASGSNSGSNPYLQGPKSAACVLARKTAAISRFRLCRPSPTMASAITAISKNFVQIVTVRLL